MPGQLACWLQFIYFLLRFVTLCLLASCAAKGPYQIELMPAPDVYEDGEVDPFVDLGQINAPPFGILYATTRSPVDNAGERPFYSNERGGVLRLGSAQTLLGRGDMTWEEARRISLLKNRTENYPLSVSGVDEFGVLDRSMTVFTDPAVLPGDRQVPAERFVASINDKLKRSKQKDVYIYVHGYKVGFENPILVSAELWHYLGYEGVFIAYSWPSTPSTWAYFGDLETTTGSAREFRNFIQFLADQTQARRIHIIGYSAGTRLVVRALNELALMSQGLAHDSVEPSLRIGEVVLLGSDVDRDIFGGYLVDGLLDVVDHVSIYVSEKDSALGIARFLFGRDRLGQWEPGALSPIALEYLRKTERLSIINVTDAEGSTSDNGHRYFRKSPWVSSDVLVTLRYHLRPGERGLIRSRALPIWQFPADYLERLRATLRRVHPELMGGQVSSASGENGNRLYP